MRSIAAWALLATLACGCGPDRAEQLLPSGASRKVPVDALEPGELAEGEEIAFGMRLPRHMRITSRQAKAVIAEGHLKFEDASNFVRNRVDAKHIDTGPTRTKFIEAVPLRDKTKTVEVEVSVARRGVQIIVRDRTRTPAEPGLSSEERWRRAGLTPGGKVTKEQSE